jgi:hypothetical protein
VNFVTSESARERTSVGALGLSPASFDAPANQAADSALLLATSAASTSRNRPRLSIFAPSLPFSAPSSTDA